MISLIAAVSKNGVIGLNNRLPWNYPSDAKYFRDKVSNKIIIMGRKTFESNDFPKSLIKKSIVITSNDEWFVPHNINIVKSIQEGIDLANEINTDNQEIFVIGGQRIYEQTIDIVDKIYITLIDKEHEGDTYFPKFDWNKFTVVKRSSIEENNTTLDFIEAIRI